MIAKDSIINAHANQFIEKCRDTGAELNSNEIHGINFLTRKLFEFELWDKFVAIYPFVGRSATSNSINLKNILRHTIRWFNEKSLIHDERGVTNIGNGYGNTFVAPGLFNDDNIHVSVYNATFFPFLNSYSPIIGSSLPNDFDNKTGRQNKWIHTIHLKYPEITKVWTYSCGNVASNASMAGEDAGDFLNAAAVGLIVGVDGTKCYLNGKRFGFYNPLRVGKTIYLNMENSDPIEGITYDWTQYPFMLFTNRAFGDPSQGYANANIRFASIGHSLTDKDVENLNFIIEESQSLLNRTADKPIIAPDNFSIDGGFSKAQLDIEKIYKKPNFEKTNIMYKIESKLEIKDIKTKGPRRVYTEDNINFGVSFQSFQEI